MMNSILANIYARRSIRAFLPDAPPPYQIEEILQAGRMAPSGNNLQASHFLVIQSQEVLSQLKALVIDTFAGMEITPDLPPSVISSIQKAETGTYDFLYGAPLLVLGANRMDHGNAMADVACALENMMLAATSFHLGSCWINQLRWLREHPAIRAHLLSLGMSSDETIYGGLALGYAAKQPTQPLPRTGNHITYI